MAEKPSCPICFRDDFKSYKGLTRHINSMQDCKLGIKSAKHWESERMSSKSRPGRKDAMEEDDQEEDAEDEAADRMTIDSEGDEIDDLVDKWDEEDRDLFHFVENPIEEDEEMVEIGQAGPGPSTRDHRRSQAQTKKFRIHVLDEDDDSRFEVVNDSAGKVIKMDASIHARWQALSGNDTMDVDQHRSPSSSGDNMYAPFASELEWRVAKWAVMDGIGNNSLDRLLAIPGVSPKRNM